MKALGLAQGKLEKPFESLLKFPTDGTLYGCIFPLQSASNVVATPNELLLGPATLLRKFWDSNPNSTQETHNNLRRVCKMFDPTNWPS